MSKEELIRKLFVLRSDKPREFWELHDIKYLENAVKVTLYYQEQRAEEETAEMC